MNEQGLAQQQAQAGQIDPVMVQRVAEALMQGMSPEELLQQGVPPEVIQAAMQMVQAQTQASQVGPEQAGLAGTQVQGGM